MTKPDKPLEAKGCGCGFGIVVICIAYLLSNYLGISENISIYIAAGLAIAGVIAYWINEFKAQKVLDHEYEATKTPPKVPGLVARDEVACPFCGETILRMAKKCKHCGSMLK